MAASLSMYIQAVLEVKLVAGGANTLDRAPKLHDDESFSLLVQPAGAVLQAASFSGVHRGLEAFAQLTVRNTIPPAFS